MICKSKWCNLQEEEEEVEKVVKIETRLYNHKIIKAQNTDCGFLRVLRCLKIHIYLSPYN